MLFTSLLFLLVFMPAATICYYAARPLRLDGAVLIVVSLVFYGYMDPRLLPLIVISIAANWIVANLALASGRRRWAIVYGGVALNLAVLAVFKYADFFTGALADAGIIAPRKWGIVLPLAISFFTFHEISYLVDIGRGTARRYTFQEYAIYILFFPHLIAGPIVRHNEFVFQLEEARRRKLVAEQLGRGFIIFVMGLGKKILLADPIAQVIDPLFASAGTLSVLDAWVAAVGFALQIYFDFSGYTDMAIGLALMLGFVLPQNFDAPYRATSLIEFWRRWHMTLSRYLRDYLYIPLGGNRHGARRQVAALLATMVLGGLWHGANWTFVAWGALHGAGLIVNHFSRWASLRVPSVLGWAATFLFATICFVIFRAPDIATAMTMISSLVDAQGAGSVGTREVALVILGLTLAVIGPTNDHLAFRKSVAPRWSGALIGAAFAGIVIIILASPTYAPFIYFQF